MDIKFFMRWLEQLLMDMQSIEKAAENLLKAQNPIQFEIDAWNLYYKLGYLTIYCTNHDFGYLVQMFRGTLLLNRLPKKKESHQDMSINIKKNIS